MKTIRRRSLALVVWVISCFAIASPACTVCAETLTGRVVRVADGDTITVLDPQRQEHKIRLSGIDAPEKAQPFGQRSKENLARLAYGQDVEVVWSKRDRYGRIVGRVMVPPLDCRSCKSSLDASMAQLTAGMAWWYRKYAPEQLPDERRRYELAEAEAKAKQVGLWRDPDPVAPWDWRRGMGGILHDEGIDGLPWTVLKAGLAEQTGHTL